MHQDWIKFQLKCGNKEGARAGFEVACLTILQGNYPAQRMQQMNSSGGDGGVDIFFGEIGQKEIISFQCKFFLDKFADSQKTQIKNSFYSAFKNPNYNLVEISYFILKTETGLKRGVAELIYNLNLGEYKKVAAFESSLLWFCKIISFLYAYQLKSGGTTVSGKLFSWFRGEIYGKEGFLQLYKETDPEPFRVLLNHDPYNYINFWGVKDYFAQFTDTFYYKYRLPNIMNRLISTSKNRLFYNYWDVTINDE